MVCMVSAWCLHGVCMVCRATPPVLTIGAGFSQTVCPVRTIHTMEWSLGEKAYVVLLGVTFIAECLPMQWNGASYLTTDWALGPRYDVPT